ncbi:MAG TPA: extracellular solute-binding protein [Symbiobacteriaceae bacterium]
MKRVTGWLLVVILLLGLTACARGQQPQTPGTENGQLTLRMLTMKQAAYSDQSIQEMVRQFEEQHPNIKVDVTFVPYESLHDKIVTDQASGSGEYDVVLVDAYSGRIRPLIPVESVRLLRLKSTTRSDGTRPLIPVQIDHL